MKVTNILTLIQSLTFKVIIAVVFAQLFILSMVGFVYIREVTSSIDSTIVNRLNSIGALLQDSHLKYAALADREVLTELVGEELIDGMVVGVNGTIYHSLDKRYLGKSVTSIPLLQLNWFNPTNVEPQIIQLDEEGDTSLISITPIFTMNSTRPFLFGYIKLDSSRYTAQKSKVISDVVLGVFGCILFSSLIIYLFLRRFIFNRLSRAVIFTEVLAKGELSNHIETTSKDEIGALEKGLNSMALQLLNRMGQRDEAEKNLLESKENLECRVDERTMELSSVVNDLQLEAASHKKTSLALKRQSSFMHLLQRIILSSNESSSLEGAWVVGLNSICTHFQWPVGVAYTLDSKTKDSLIFSGQVSIDEPNVYRDFVGDFNGVEYKTGEGLVGGVLRSGRPQWAVIQEGTSEQAKKAKAHGFMANFALPILIGREVVAVFEFYTKTEDHQDSDLFEIARDIGIQLGRVVERRRAEEYLNEAKIASDIANVAKTEFISKLGHELRTPINAIVGFSELIQSQLDVGERRQLEQLDIITRAGRHMVQLVDQVTDLARIEVGDFPINLEAVDLISELTNTVDMLKLLAGQNNAAIEVSGVADDDNIVVIADITGLQQVFMNLISNAIYYSNMGRLEPDTNHIKVIIDNSFKQHVLIKIHDTGSPISPEEMLEIFKPLTRLDRHRGLVDGLGIGLTLSKELVEGMGGDVSVASNHGAETPIEQQGNSFTIKLRRS